MSWRAPFAALALTAGCVTVAPAVDPGVAPPFNACPAHDCAAYTQPGASPICNGGACLVASTYSDLVLVVSLSADSFFAPGETFAIVYGDLDKTPPSAACPSDSNPPCKHLPAYAIVQGAYLVTPQTQSPQYLNWNLGNPGVSTALPVHVTYRPLWPPTGPAATAVDATDVGLPLDPTGAFVVVESAPSSPPGPGQGTSIGFQANLQPGNYEATIQPDPPFDAIFPPDVKRVTLAPGGQNDNDTLFLDTTSVETGGGTGAQIPTFDLSRVGLLTGWKTYLRDATTLRRISPLVTLGSRTTGVRLPTNHHPPGGDALTNAELVLEPPASAAAIPTYKAGLLGGTFSQTQTFPTLEAPVTVTGTVTDVDGATPVESELFFEATSIAVAGPPPSLNAANFEYTARATAVLDATGATSSYSVILPPGQYRVTARPLDQAHGITILPAFSVAPVTGAGAPQVMVDALRPVQGYTLVSDGRPMAGATVEAIPSGCTSGASPVCMPRPADTTTAANGTFALALDPGSYTLRVRPQEGTRFPWVTQPLLVGPTAVTAPALIVPAPVHAGLQLLDPFDDPVVSAVIRIYQVPASGVAVEVGRSFTDATGTYDLYLAPSSQ